MIKLLKSSNTAKNLELNEKLPSAVGKITMAKFTYMMQASWSLFGVRH